MGSDDSLPKMWDLLFPVLQAVRREGGTASITKIVHAVVEDQGFTEKQMRQVGSNDRETIPYRMAWARSYLKKAGLLDNVERAVWAVTELGSEVDEAETMRLVKEVAGARRRDVVKDAQPVVTTVAVHEAAVGNADQLSEYLGRWHRMVGEELLDQVIASPPAFLERIIVDLLEAMGYAGRDGWAMTVGGKGDGGVDGVVVEDQLGMRKLYCQAKRYAKDHPIRPADIREFIGALDIKHRQEGVFVTTSRFTQDARETASLSTKHLSLIDGAYLAELMLRYDIAVTSHPFVFKQIDPDY